MSSAIPTTKYYQCQVIIIGSQRNRIAKVASFLVNNNLVTFPSTTTTTTTISAPKNKNCNNDLDNTPGNSEINIKVEYIPCVASFNSFTNEETRETTRYLSSVEYHGDDGTQKRGSTIAPFFDNQTIDDDGNDNDGCDEISAINLGVIAIAIGSGIEDNQDVDKIRSLIDMLNGQKEKSKLEDSLSIILPIVEVIQPNEIYSSMKEETEAFRAMTLEEKAEAARMQSIGPSKMSAFAKELAKRTLHQLLRPHSNQNNNQPDSNECSETLMDGIVSESEQEKENSNEVDTVDTELPSPSLTPYEIAKQNLPFETLASKIYYSCRLCRTPLFTSDDLENPPHHIGKHGFNPKKTKSQYSSPSSSTCQSVFLADGLSWMEDISLNMEGRILCPHPKCLSKIGGWKWAGTQCSCGTWVTPAIQFPLSKVDKNQSHIKTYSNANINHAEHMINNGFQHMSMQG